MQPLMFAVSTGAQDIVTLLESSEVPEGGRMDLTQDVDFYGNTPLHFSVWHNRVNMYEHVLKLVKNRREKHLLKVSSRSDFAAATFSGGRGR
eukprot:SAG11_NODE_16164_length_555_cov_1.269737_1_plen_91_part_01